MYAKPKLTILEPQDIEKIHASSIQILETVGVKHPHPEARRLFREASAWVDDETEIVKIPEALINQTLASAEKTFTLYGRGNNQQAAFGKGKQYGISSAGQALWVDDSGQNRRYASLGDVTPAARLGDALPNVHIVGALADPHEIPVSYRCVEVAVELAKNTTKPVQLWFSDRASATYLLEVVETITGSREEVARRPLTFAFLEPISPLRYPFDGVDVLFETAKYHLPVGVGPMAQVGLSAPGTLFGTIVQENAEILAGICLVQLIKPGLPLFYSGIPHAFDMRTTQVIFAGPEQALMAIAMVQMAKYYGLPVGVNVGMIDSKLVDAQAGMESGVTMVAGAMAGADTYGALGICGADQGASLATLVMQNEIIGYIERITRGIDLSPDKLGLEVVQRVGPGGSYLAEEHTVRNFRSELWFPGLLDRNFWPVWSEKGGYDLHKRAIEKKDTILQKHHPEPLEEAMCKELDRIVLAARKHLSCS